MTIINNSLAYSGETLVYNNECELLWSDYIDPCNPLNLPPNTVRVRTNDGAAPKKISNTSYETATLVEGTTDVYDVYKSGTDFAFLFFNSNNVEEVLGANTTGITNMYAMFNYCTSLTNVALFDTSSVTDMRIMFVNCYSLTSVPLFDTSSVTNMYSMFNKCSALTSAPLFNTSSVVFMNGMFEYCNNVQSGALALYQQASTQANPPSKHTGAFKNCGSDTTTGAAELAQIPDDWK